MNIVLFFASAAVLYSLLLIVNSLRLNASRPRYLVNERCERMRKIRLG